MDLFGETFVTADLAESWVRSRGCPFCDAPLRAAVGIAWSQHWVCSGCGRCWTLVHGRLHGVDPLTCQGCATRTKAACLSLFGARFPAFTCGGLPDEVRE